MSVVLPISQERCTWFTNCHAGASEELLSEPHRRKGESIIQWREEEEILHCQFATYH